MRDKDKEADKGRGRQRRGKRAKAMVREYKLYFLYIAPPASTSVGATLNPSCRV